MIFFLFKPLDIKQQIFDDIPLFEISSFTLYELNTESLITLMSGDKSIRYKDRYTVSNIDYTDNSKKYIANMKADNGIYKDDIISLTANVKYMREDGLVFKTQNAIYNKKTNITYIEKDFSSQGQDYKLNGEALRYNNVLNTALANRVTVSYQLKESK